MNREEDGRADDEVEVSIVGSRRGVRNMLAHNAGGRGGE